jgi:hypothetical protein
MQKTVFGLTLVLLLAFTARVALAIPQPDSSILEDIVHFRVETWHYESLMGVRKTPAAKVSLEAPHDYKLRLRSIWQGRALKTKRHFQAGPPHEQAWLCIHRYEGSWRDGGAPYYGGLQMDYSFMHAYGAALLRTKGTADRWTPMEQMWVAERAFRAGRGFYPWPNTARACGLI